MALSDTAALIASLELQDKFSSTVSKYDKAVSGMQSKSNTLDKVGFQIGRGARNTIDNVGRIALVGAGLVASQVALGVRSLAQLAEVENQTAAVIKSTGAAANVTTEQIRAQAEALEDLSTVDDKAIQAGQNLLLTFTNIRNEAGEGNDIFNQATETLLDLSVAMGTEPKAAAGQLGKALNDPVKGITALTRVGVTFTAAQKKQIERFAETNRLADAQKVILQELQKEFGGSAEAFGKGPGADMRRFGDAVEGAQQALATGFLPVMRRVSALVQEALGDPEVQANIKSFGTSLAQGIEGLISVGTKLPWDAIGASAKLMGTGAKALLDAFLGLPPWVQTAVLTGWGLNKLTGGALGGIAGTLAGALGKGIFSRGGTPATPMFTKEVGLPGTTAPLTGGKGFGGFLATALKVAIPVAIGVAIAQGLRELALQVDPGSDARKAAFEARGGGFFGLDPFGKKVESSTPQGQFNAANKGGTVPVRVLNMPEGTFKLVGEAIRTSSKAQQEAIKDGDIHQARLLQDQEEALHQLRGTFSREVNRIIPHLGRTNSALSTANANLRDGNARQRDIAARVAEARDRIGTGFQASNAHLSTIAAKNFSPSITVTVPVTSNVSISQVTRTSVSTAFATGAGFTSGGNSIVR